MKMVLWQVRKSLEGLSQNSNIVEPVLLAAVNSDNQD